MVAKVIFFPVGNGDMTLIELESGRKILIDVNIRESTDGSNKSIPDVISMLRQRLTRDKESRLYIDAFLWSHPDRDHCLGIDKHFHLGPPEKFSDDKIFIREIWSSPIVFRRASKKHDFILCEDAKALRREAKRRVKYFRDNGYAGVTDGNRIQILGEDEKGKTDDLTDILVKVDELITKVNGVRDSSMTARLLGPLPKAEDEDDEEALAKNRSSVILQFSLGADGCNDACQFLTGGDAEVKVWERLWEKHQSDPDWLQYDILLAPHHCSWHSLSHDSWSDKREEAEVSQNARNALSQTKEEGGACIIASSKPISDEDSDPPCIRAKREYRNIVSTVSGKFICTGEYPSSNAPDLLVIEIRSYGPRLESRKAPAIIPSGAIGRQPLPHG